MEMTTETERTDSGYVVRIRNIAADSLQKDYVVTVGDDHGTITYSPMNYCYKVLNGGTVTAAGGDYGAGIGSGYGDESPATCGDVTIMAEVFMVNARRGIYADNSIGSGKNSTCGVVTIEPGASVITQ